MTKKAKIIAGVVGGVLLVGGIGSIFDKDKEKDNNSSDISSSISENISNSVSEPESIFSTDSEVSDSISVFDNPLADVLQLENSSTVNDDKTGNWRYNTTTDGNFFVEEHIADYYEHYYNSDSEVHFIINFTNLTVARINYFGGDEFYIDYFEHVEFEENHAELLCTGKPLNQYIANKSTGEVERIDENDPAESSSEPSSAPESEPQSTPQEAESRSEVLSVPSGVLEPEQSSVSSSSPDNTVQQTTTGYILNTNTMVFHYPKCSSVSTIKDEHKATASSRDEAVSSGYKPCGRCKP